MVTFNPSNTRAHYGPKWHFLGSVHILAVTALMAFLGPKNNCYGASPNGSSKVPGGFGVGPGG